MTQAQAGVGTDSSASPVLVGLMSALAYGITVHAMHSLGTLIWPPPLQVVVDRFAPEVVPLGLICAAWSRFQVRPSVVWTTLGVGPVSLLSIVIVRSWLAGEVLHPGDVTLSVCGVLLGSLFAARVVVSSYRPAPVQDGSKQGQ